MAAGLSQGGPFLEVELVLWWWVYKVLWLEKQLSYYRRMTSSLTLSLWGNFRKSNQNISTIFFPQKCFWVCGYQLTAGAHPCRYLFWE